MALLANEQFYSTYRRTFLLQTSRDCNAGESSTDRRKSDPECRPLKPSPRLAQPLTPPALRESINETSPYDTSQRKVYNGALENRQYISEPAIRMVDLVSDIRSRLLAQNKRKYLHTLEFPNSTPELFQEVLQLTDNDPKLQGWRVEYYNGTIITLPSPGHELLDNFWAMVSHEMISTAWLSTTERFNIHVHQANITLADPPGDSLRPDLCILPSRPDHFPTILFESVLTQTYKSALKKTEAWFKGSMGRIGFVVIINFLYPKNVVKKPDCTIEMWKHGGAETGFKPELAQGPKTIYPIPDEQTDDEQTDDEDVAISFTYEEFFGADDIPEIYKPIKDTPFSWSMKSLRHAVKIALRSHSLEINFQEEMNLKRKRPQAEDNDEKVGRNYSDVRPAPTIDTDKPSKIDRANDVGDTVGDTAIAVEEDSH